MERELADGPEKENGTQMDGMPLEDAFSMLESTVDRLEEEGLTLEEAFAEYQKGMRLLEYCKSRIDQVEKKVLVLNEEGGLDEF